MYGNLTEFLATWKDNATYFEMLKLLASLSKLFSESTTPFLDYRLAENLFCKYFNAQNDARSCTAYDARLANLGIGIKTFGIDGGTSMEKIAEFNKLKPKLNGLTGLDLARKIAEFRNQRMQFSNDTYDVVETQYHIVGRQEGCLKVFNTPYDEVEIDSISDVVDKEASISFTDGINEYSFNKSKSVLQKKFILPAEYKEVPVVILDEPLELLSSLLGPSKLTPTPASPTPTPTALPTATANAYVPGVLQPYTREKKGVDYVILPLYSRRRVPHVPYVPDRSGLNQWNAKGRPRHVNEVYIPVPRSIHANYPDFFPGRDQPFDLILPNGDVLSAKICQDGGKALMSNPNSALGEWILRKVLRKAEGELLTIDDLDKYGIDSVKITSTHRHNSDGVPVYKIVFTDTGYEDYSSFIED